MWTSHCIIRYVEFVQHRLIRTSLLLLVTFVVWNASVFIYSSFRHLCVPSPQTHKLPIEFTFVPCAPHDQNAKGGASSKCSFPKAAATMPTMSLDSATRYSVSVRFQLVAANVRTFIVCLDVRNGEDNVCRPVRLTSKSEFARFVDFLLIYPFDVLRHLLTDGSVASATDQSETREVEFFNGFTMTTDDDQVDAVITVKDVQVDVLSAELIMRGLDSGGGGSSRHPDLGKYVAVCLLSFSILFCSTWFWRWLTRPEVVTTVVKDFEVANKKINVFPGKPNVVVDGEHFEAATNKQLFPGNRSNVGGEDFEATNKSLFPGNCNVDREQFEATNKKIPVFSGNRNVVDGEDFEVTNKQLFPENRKVSASDETAEGGESPP